MSNKYPLSLSYNGVTYPARVTKTMIVLYIANPRLAYLSPRRAEAKYRICNGTWHRSQGSRAIAPAMLFGSLVSDGSPEIVNMIKDLERAVIIRRWDRRYGSIRASAETRLAQAVFGAERLLLTAVRAGACLDVEIDRLRAADSQTWIEHADREDVANLLGSAKKHGINQDNNGDHADLMHNFGDLS